MRIRSIRFAASTAALMALFQPQLAFAQTCVDQQDLSDAVVYAMPMLTNAFEQKCSTELDRDGFLATQGEAFTAPYISLRSESWPGALRLIKVLIAKGGQDANSSGNGEIAALITGMPEDTVRPFVDALVVQKVSEQINVSDCGETERGLELLSPLPPENTGDLAAFVLEITGVQDPAICPYSDK